ncbi:MAG: reverse transcriptase-like protein [Endomicrobium sp.]|jgi:ribonuclease HI|nr:reverse transcriptase-like protein [Endomicrobium sp.]
MLYKSELQNKALELQNMLRKQNVSFFFDSNSFKDYSVKITIFTNNKSCGNILIYYKPTRNTYSIKKQLYNSEIDTTIDLAWDKINYFGTYSAESNVYEAFVDGSYIAGITGYGTIIYLGNEIKAEISGTISNTQFRQFGGELRSVIEAVKWCQNNNVKKVRINYDYQGIEKFVSGKWKAKNILSKEYVDFILKTKIEIEWRHIKSHTGNPKNDKADFLAQKAAMRNTQLTNNLHRCKN